MRSGFYFAEMMNAMETLNAILLKNTLETRRDTAESMGMWLALKRLSISLNHDERLYELSLHPGLHGGLQEVPQEVGAKEAD